MDLFENTNASLWEQKTRKSEEAANGQRRMDF